MHFVAVGALDAFRVHLALQERVVLVVVVFDLPVGVKQRLGEQRRQGAVEERRTGHSLVAELGAPRVARRAALDQLGAGKVAGSHRQLLTSSGMATSWAVARLTPN